MHNAVIAVETLIPGLIIPFFFTMVIGHYIGARLTAQPFLSLLAFSSLRCLVTGTAGFVWSEKNR